VVGGCVVVVVGVCVVGVCVVGVCVVVDDEVGCEVDCVTGGVVPFVDDGEEVAVDVDVVGVFVVFAGVFASPPVAGEDVVSAAADGDDLPLDRTANQSFSTPCPLAWPFFLSLTNV
jgi:hypothetical protein